MSDLDANYQNIVRAADAYYDQSPDHPDIKEYGRWKSFWELRAQNDSNSNSFLGAFETWAFPGGCNNFPCTDDQYQADWTALGPGGPQGNNGYIGRVQTVGTDPHDPDKQIVFAGTATSGLYKTENINAAMPEWECLTCNTGLPVLGIMDIAIDPTVQGPGDTATIYLAIAIEMYTTLNYGAGFLRSTNGGKDWDLIHPVPNSNLQARTWAITHHPVLSGRVYASVNGSLFESIDGGDQWSLVFELYTNKRYIRDIVFHPTNPNVLYVSGDNQNGKEGGASFFVLTYEESSQTWSYSEYHPFEELGWNILCKPGRIDLAVTPFEPHLVFLSVSKENTACDTCPNPCTVEPSFKGQLIVFDYSSGTFEKRGNTVGSWNMADIAIAPLLKNGNIEIYLGQVKIWKSEDSGWSFGVIQGGATTFHDDTRGLHTALRSDGKQIILSAHDGGVSIFHEVNGVEKWENKTGTGLNIAQFYGIGAANNRSKYLGGCQDEAVKFWNGSVWGKVLSGDGGDCLADIFDPDLFYAQTWTQGSRGLYRRAPNGTWTWIYNASISYGPNDAGYIRPMSMDQARNLYIGHNELYRKEHTGENWMKIGSLEKPGEHLRAMAIAPSNENVIVVTRGGAWTYDTLDNLLITRDAGMGTEASWLKIDDFKNLYGGGGSGGGPIATIVFDPLNENRFWIGTGEFIRNYKVVMFEYQGTEWKITNVSDGLCNIPVYSLAYVKGSNHAMYVGTEFGVYYNPNASDPESQWVCFADGMPACIIHEIEINYCSNTLIAAGFGCGMWETPLAPYPENRPLEITQNTTINSPRVFYSDVIIKSGVTLTVESQAYMSKGRKIIIRPGARMIVDGGTLSTLCDDYWYGVYVEGQNDQPQAGTSAGGPQGVLILKDALVEKAWSAVNLYGASGSGTVWETTGGVILASEQTIFRNNVMDLKTYPYTYVYPPPFKGQPNNHSRFTDCIFETTDEFRALPSDTPQEYAHVSLFGVKGISFTACTFEDARTQPSAQVAGFTGISSHNSQFLVQGRCNPPGQPCETWTPAVFKNLHRAVNAGNFGENRPFTVDRSSFVNNHYGVQSWAVDYLTVTRSRFEGGGSPVVNLLPYEQDPRCITIYGGTEYTVEENTLIGGPTAFDNLMGIVVIETGEDFNSIYKNDLSGLTFGNLALGLNRGNLPLAGLGYDCNKNDDNLYDFKVPDPSGFYSQAGIRQNQGSAQTSAGNKFSPMPPLPESHFFNTAFAPVTYFYKAGEPEDEPVNYSGGVGVIQAFDPNACLSRFDQDTVISIDPVTYKGRFYQKSAQFDSLKNVLETKIDGGDSQSLVQSIGSSTTADSQAVRAQLIQLSPYVSQVALMEYIGRDDLFSEDQIVEVLALNPDVLRLPAFWASVQGVLSPSSLAQLEGVRQNRTQRTDEEAAIAAVGAERAYAARRLVHYYMGDTLAYQADSARHWIAQVETLPHQYVLAGQHFQEGDTAQAANILNVIPSGFSLTSAQWAAHADYEALLDIWEGKVEHGDWISFAQENETELKSLADQGVSRAAVQAQFLYNVVFGPTYQPPVNWTEGGSQSAGKAVPPASEEIPGEVSGGVRLAVIPNPARELVQFHYEIPSLEKGAQLRVFDPAGRIVRFWELKTTTGVIQWQISGEAPKGIYLASLVADGKAPVTIRFSIVE